MIDQTGHARKTVVVIGNGMVGHRFCERLAGFDVDRHFQIVTFCEERRPAYDRVNLSKYFEKRDAEHLKLACESWYAENGITLHVGDRASTIDRARRVVVSEKGREVGYDVVVLATGSAPFVPSVPGVDKKGVFVYRTIEDLEAILAYAGNSASAAVIGGGLLGLEAAKAVRDLGLETHVVEFAPRLMPRQVDDAGSKTLLDKIEGMNVRVHLGKSTREFLGNGKVEGLAFADGGQLDVDMVVISAGIRPRDELARACGLEVGPRGGVVVDDALRTSDPDIFAIGEVATHRGYGLRPGRPRLRNGRSRRGKPYRGDADVLRLRYVHEVEAHGSGRRQLRRPVRGGQRREGVDLRRPVRGRLQEACLQPRGHPPTGRRSGRRRLRLRQPCSACSRAGSRSRYLPVSCCRRGIGAACSGDARRPDLFMQQRQRASDPRGGPRPEAHDRRAGQDLHPGRHRLRWLSTSRHRSAQGGTPGNGCPGRQPALRALPTTAGRSFIRSR